jgi:gamma-glutamylcyclotransferase (GGCT)/AIG2-like uncharacterized protein YtfP
MTSHPIKVFVYGTLLRGEANHHLLAAAQFLGPGRTQAEYDLVNLGAYPAMVPGASTAVTGEVYAVNDKTLRRLDQLEGHPHFFRRQTIQLGDGTQVLAYFLSREQAQGYPPIKSGDWIARDADRQA